MDNSIQFDFPDRRSALNALDTLQELGYQPVYNDGSGSISVHIHVEQDDLVSALEIAQCYGGQLVDRQRFTESQAFASAYELDLQDIRIPAHMVNEDLVQEDIAKEALGDDPIQGDTFSADIRI